jgi:hypothetical protein
MTEQLKIKGPKFSNLFSEVKSKQGAKETQPQKLAHSAMAEKPKVFVTNFANLG